MEQIDPTKMIVKREEIISLGILSVEGTIAGQPAMWIGSESQIGCMRFPPPEKKEKPAAM